MNGLDLGGLALTCCLLAIAVFDLVLMGSGSWQARRAGEYGRERILVGSRMVSALMCSAAAVLVGIIGIDAAWAAFVGLGALVLVLGVDHITDPISWPDTRADTRATSQPAPSKPVRKPTPMPVTKSA